VKRAEGAPGRRSTERFSRDRSGGQQPNDSIAILRLGWHEPLLNRASLIGTLQHKELGARLTAEVEVVRGARLESEAMMGKWLRRIRGAIGMGVTWAAVWFTAGFVPRWVFGISSDLPFPLLFGGLGFIAGVTFSGLLVLTEGRRRFDLLSLPRFAGWGAVGGLLLSALFVRGASYGLGEVLAISTTFALACAVCASGSLAVARRAVRRELPDSRGDTTEPELTDQEKRKLL
jgi:hypothetical protein